jgi:multisubunit Na+/H+ antiporter MnhB subunit
LSDIERVDEGPPPSRHFDEPCYETKPMKLFAIVLIALGVAALVYRGFEYRTEETVFKVGPIEARAERDKRVEVPVWAGAGGVGVGVALLLLATRKRKS